MLRHELAQVPVRGLRRFADEVQGGGAGQDSAKERAGRAVVRAERGPGRALIGPWWRFFGGGATRVARTGAGPPVAVLSGRPVVRGTIG